MCVLVAGLVLGFLCGMVAFAIIDTCEPWGKDWGKFCWTALIVCTLIGGWSGCFIEQECSHSYVNSYEVTKATIEDSLTADNLSGFERVELVKQATEINGALARTKYTASKWYGFNIDDRVADLEYIDLSVANE